MKRSIAVMGSMILIVCVSLMFVTGCTKKAVSKDEGMAAAASTQKSDAAMAAQQVKPEPAPVAPQPTNVKELALRQDAATGADMAAKAKIEFEDIHFAFDKATIEPGARTILKKLGDWMLQNKKNTLLIEGHCDERGTVEYNLALGQRRADAAMKYLVDLGVDKANISTISYGKERPLDPGHSEEAWAKNRRDNFVVKSK